MSLPRNPRILVSNDDGIHATGLAVLIDIANVLSDDVWVFAPEQDQSGVARSLTLTEPLRIREVNERHYAVSGTPADCVQLGAGHIIPKYGKAPDLVLSGVNNGQNLGEHVTVSGTIAAAFQGMQLGIPSLALSLARFSEKPKWQTPRQHAPEIIEKLLAKGWPSDVVINLNFPDRAPDDIVGIEVTSQGIRDQDNLFTEERMDLRGRKYYWYGFDDVLSNPPEGTDLRAIYDGRISITPLHLSVTHEDAIRSLGQVFQWKKS